MRGGGGAGTSLDAVLDASDTSKSQLYHYFADKDDLVLCVIRRQTECVLATHGEYLDGVTSIAGLRRWRDAIVALTRQDCACQDRERRRGVTRASMVVDRHATSTKIIYVARDRPSARRSTASGFVASHLGISVRRT